MLGNFEVINELKNRYGVEIRSSQQFNKILGALGLIKNIRGEWWQTDFGMQFSPLDPKHYAPMNGLRVDYIAQNIS